MVSVLNASELRLQGESFLPLRSAQLLKMMEEMSDVIARQIAINQNMLLFFFFYVASPPPRLFPFRLTRLNVLSS